MEQEERASRILSIADMIRLGYGDSPDAIWRRVRYGIIPPPVEMGHGTVGWIEREIVADERTRKRRPSGSQRNEPRKNEDPQAA
jgi:predicted DNA-binding transcriptional regulator AlpA